MRPPCRQVAILEEQLEEHSRQQRALDDSRAAALRATEQLVRVSAALPAAIAAAGGDLRALVPEGAHCVTCRNSSMTIPCCCAVVPRPVGAGATAIHTGLCLRRCPVVQCGRGGLPAHAAAAGSGARQARCALLCHLLRRVAGGCCWWHATLCMCLQCSIGNRLPFTLSRRLEATLASLAGAAAPPPGAEAQAQQLADLLEAKRAEQAALQEQLLPQHAQLAPPGTASCWPLHMCFQFRLPAEAECGQLATALDVMAGKQALGSR